MGGASSEGSEARFATYVEALGAVLGHADRREPMRDYCLGLLMPIARKSVEPMAAVTAPAQVAAKHQSLLHFVGNAPWSDAAMLAKVSELVLPAIERSGPVEAWIIDDTGFPKKGQHSVGVTRQYCGQLGKRDNCQVAVTLSLANHHASLPVAYRLYLPQEWADDHERRHKAARPLLLAERLLCLSLGTVLRIECHAVRPEVPQSRRTGGGAPSTRGANRFCLSDLSRVLGAASR